MANQKIKVKLNRGEVRKLLRSQEMMNVCTEFAYSAQSRLGEGYEVSYRTGKNRVNAEVAAVSPEARQENSDNNSIMKALG